MPGDGNTRTELQNAEFQQWQAAQGYQHSHEEGRKKEDIKVHMGLCVDNCLVGEMMAGAGSIGMWG